MSSLDVNKFIKHKFEDIKDDLELLKDERNVSRTLLTQLFSNRTEKGPDGKIKIIPAKYRVTDYFDLPKGFLINQPNPQPNTTIGSYLFNAFVLCNAFENGKVAYYDKELNNDNYGAFHQSIADCILEGTISVKEYGKYASMTVWLGYFTELFMPGVSLNFIVPNKQVIDYKKQLLKENESLIKGKKIFNSDEVAEFENKVEAPLIKKAKEVLKDDPTMRVYNLSKPSFGNNFKNSNIINGPLHDPVSGQYKINYNCYNEGITKESFDILANKAMTSAYSRAVATQDGGTMTKYLSVAMQNIKLGPKGSDCGTKGYILFKVDKAHWSYILYDYMVEDNGSITLIVPQLKSKLMGKTIKLRTPLYCKAKDYYCNHCAGDRYYRLGISNIGMTATSATGFIMNKNMKAMHDVSVHTTDVDISRLMTFEK